MALQANAVLTLAELKNRLEIKEKSDIDDKHYEDMINSISDFLPNHLGREIIADAAADEIFDGTGESVYYVKDRLFNNIDVDVPVLSYRSSNTEWTVMTTSIYPREFDVAAGAVYLVGSIFSSGSRNYKINYKGGWAIADVPDSIKVAAAELVKRTHKRMNKTGIKMIKTGDSVTSYDFYNLMNEAIRSLLAPYRVMSFG